MVIKWAAACIIFLVAIICVSAYDPDFVVTTDNNPNQYSNPNSNPYSNPNPDIYPSQDDQGGMYSYSISESPSTLISEDNSGQYPKATAYDWGSNQNIFHIVSANGNKVTQYVDMPLYSYARALIIPAYSGQLILEETYPSGNVRQYQLGWVPAHSQYRLWFYADSSGIHTSRYYINGQPSDTVTHNVH
jgi:hypothetical protein